MAEFCDERLDEEADFLQSFTGSCLLQYDYRGYLNGFDVLRGGFEQERIQWDVVAYAVSVDAKFLHDLYPTTSLVSSVELVMLIEAPTEEKTQKMRIEPASTGEQHQIQTLLHSQIYPNIVLLTTNQRITFPLDPPVNIHSSIVLVEMTLRGVELGRKTPDNEIYQNVFLSVISCPISDSGSFETTCDRPTFYHQWTERTSDQCNTQVDKYEAYQICIGEADSSK